MTDESHPEYDLFAFAAGNSSGTEADEIARHLEGCSRCAIVVSLVRAARLRRERARTAAPDEVGGDHPSVAEVAACFYGQLSGPAQAQVAAHAAGCASCAVEMAFYGGADEAASRYEPSAGAVPAKAWEMIREWEESAFARPKTIGYGLPAELLSKLHTILKEREKELELRVASVASRLAARPETADLVPVLVIGPAGEFRGIEVFEKSAASESAETLSHVEQSPRYENRPLHALIESGAGEEVVVSNPISDGKVDLERARRDARRTRYVIIED